MNSYLAFKQDLILKGMRRIEKKLDRVLAGQVIDAAQEKKMDEDVQALIDQVSQVRGDTASTKAFITGLEQRITDILAQENLKPETKAALRTAFSDLKGASQELKDAIDNDPNTPAGAGGATGATGSNGGETGATGSTGADPDAP